MSGALKFTTEMMRADAGFHADQARRHIGKACFYLATRPLLPQHDGTALIVADNMERVLADIDADHGDCALELLGHGVLLVSGAPSQHPTVGGTGARPDHPISGQCAGARSGLSAIFRQAPSPAVTVSIGASWAMETTLSRKWTESRTRGRKLHLTEAKARVGRARKTRADLERQLKACKREIANARERLIEATKQQTATSEMLRIISDSPLQSVLDAVAEHAARLCDNTAEIYRLENNLIRLVASYGELPVHIQAREGFPVNRDRVIGRTICDRRSVNVHDLAAEDSEYPSGSSDAKRLGHRTTLGIPLMRERTLIGGILFRRWEVRPFSDDQIALLESFADQAAIAIENVRLFEAEKQRSLALAQANRDLAEREAKIRRLVDANIIGIFIWTIDGRFIEANDAFLRMVGYDREDLISDRVHRTDLTPPEWHKRLELTLAELKMTGTVQPYEEEYFRKDGSRVPVLIGAAAFDEKR